MSRVEGRFSEKKSRKYLLETFIKHFPAVKERSSTSLIISGDNKQEEYHEVYFLFVVWAVTCLPFCFCKIGNGSVDLPASGIFRSGSHFLRDSHFIAHILSQDMSQCYQCFLISSITFTLRIPHLSPWTLISPYLLGWLPRVFTNIPS